MPTRSILLDETRTFAGWLNDLLNGTVSNGIRMTVEREDRLGEAWVIFKGGSMPLAVDAKSPRAHLVLHYRLGLDDSRRFLAVRSSFVGLFRDAASTEPLLHYDFERGKGDGYPEAHVQVHAASEPWSRLTKLMLAKLHLPVGGRRFRPCLEDLIEFLIVEDLVDCRPGWQRLVEKGRERYRDIQLAAAMRANPRRAHEVIRNLEKPA